MFIFAISIGIYSYFIFFLGLLGLLYKPVIIVGTVLYIVAIIVVGWFFLAWVTHPARRHPSPEGIWGLIPSQGGGRGWVAKVGKLDTHVLILLTLFMSQAI